MYFTKRISTFLVGALLATSALGELTQVPRVNIANVGRADPHAELHAAARDAGLAEVEAALRKRADACLSAIKTRRSLAARGDTPVGVGSKASAKGQDSLSTSGLATCYGVAITGSYNNGNPEGGNDRFLIHGLEGERDPAEAIFDEVEAARANGLENLYALLVYPNPDSFTDADDFTDEDRRDVQAEKDWYVMWTTDACGVAPEEKGHDWKESWGIRINSFKGVSSGRFVG